MAASREWSSHTGKSGYAGHVVLPDRLLGIGGHSIVTAASDGKTVLKGYEAWERGRRWAYREQKMCGKLLAHEEYAYQVLGEHAHIMRSYGLVEIHPGVHSLRLERANGSVREIIKSNRTSPPSEQHRLEMALGVVSGVSHMHSKKVHYDISCRSLFLFPGWCVKLGNFDRAMVKGNLPRDDTSQEMAHVDMDFDDRHLVRDEIFQLGTALYEIMAWKTKFGDVETDDVGEFCDPLEGFHHVFGVLAGNLMGGCWSGQFDTAEDVYRALKVIQQNHRSRMVLCTRPFMIMCVICIVLVIIVLVSDSSSSS